MRLLMLLILPMLIAGCIAPIPGLETFFGKVKSFENDIIVIQSLKAYPSIVTEGQQIQLIAYIQNRGSKKQDINISLYDYCDGLFKNVQIDCGEGKKNEKSCEKSLLPKETIQIRWYLDPAKVSLETSCDLKVSVSYDYTTSGITTLHLINAQEMQRRMEQGTFQPVTSYITKGEGPIKAWFEVLSQQPIPVSDNTSIGLMLHIQNVGSGFLPSKKGNITIRTNMPKGLIGCQNLKGAKLIQKSRELPCTVSFKGSVEKELTKTITVSIDYSYEFRTQTRVTIRPKTAI